MAGRKVIVPIPPEELKNMLEISKNPPKPEVILQKKDDRTPTHTLLHITADDFAEVIDNQKAEAKEEAKAKEEAEAEAKEEAEAKAKEEAEAKRIENHFAKLKLKKGLIPKLASELIEAETNPSSGGYKKGKANAKDKYTVKELKTIASRNNIKTTKKLDGKTVPLNKKGLMAKLKRNKVI